MCNPKHCEILKFGTPKLIIFFFPNLEHFVFKCTNSSKKDTDRMANRVDPDQAPRL